LSVIAIIVSAKDKVHKQGIKKTDTEIGTEETVFVTSWVVLEHKNYYIIKRQKVSKTKQN